MARLLACLIGAVFLLTVVEMIVKAVVIIVAILAVLQLSRWLLVYSERRRLELRRRPPPLA
jgi:hypothetical protein